MMGIKIGEKVGSGKVVLVVGHVGRCPTLNDALPTYPLGGTTGERLNQSDSVGGRRLRSVGGEGV